MATQTVTKPPAARPANRRRSERNPHVMEAWLTPAGDDAPDRRREVVTIDLSRHGVGIGLDRALDVGSFHVVEIGLGSQRLISEVRVVSCRSLQADGRAFQIGAEFC